MFFYELRNASNISPVMKKKIDFYKKNMVPMLNP